MKKQGVGRRSVRGGDGAVTKSWAARAVEKAKAAKPAAPGIPAAEPPWVEALVRRVVDGVLRERHITEESPGTVRFAAPTLAGADQSALSAEAMRYRMSTDALVGLLVEGALRDGLVGSLLLAAGHAAKPPTPILSEPVAKTREPSPTVEAGSGIPTPDPASHLCEAVAAIPASVGPHGSSTAYRGERCVRCDGTLSTGRMAAGLCRQCYSDAHALVRQTQRNKPSDLSPHAARILPASSIAESGKQAADRQSDAPPIASEPVAMPGAATERSVSNPANPQQAPSKGPAGEGVPPLCDFAGPRCGGLFTAPLTTRRPAADGIAVTADLMGDPPPGRSALDQREGGA